MTDRFRTRRPSAPPARLALVAFAAVLLAGCGELFAPPPSPPEGSPGPSAAVAPTVESLSAALDRLDALGSYRFVQTLADGAGASRVAGTVVNGAEPRTRVEYTSGGAFAGGQITIGRRTWRSLAGSAYQEQDPGGLLGEDWINPVAQGFDPWALGLDEIEDLGIETHAGVQARHLRAIAIADSTLDEDGFPLGPTFAGTADAWIAVDGGYLLAVVASGTQADDPPDDAGAPPSPSPYAIDIAVDGVDDPANAIEVPEAGAVTPRPDGDPAAARLIEGLARGQRTLHSYVYLVASGSGGMELSATITVVNRPTKAAQLAIGEIAGLDGQAILVIGERTWSQTGTGPWRRVAADDPPTCGAGGDTLAPTAPCTFEQMTDVAATIRAMKDTFAVVATDDEARGIASTHLRSTAGIVEGGFTIPGTRDVWIANDGGYLVRDVFTGADLTSETRIARIDDPANALEAPSR